MAARGRPTPQPEEEDFFQDRKPEEFRRPDANPYVRSHAEFGPPLYTAEQIRAYKGRWADLFGREAPLVLEIGSGNGEFMVDIARQNPQWNYVGIEIRYKRTVLCAKKIRAAGLTNVVVARYHAAYLDDLFSDGDLVGLFVNHPDPWPKGRHEKNRLISRWFLEDAARLLKPGGFFRIKSDFPPNVDRVEELLDRGPEGEPMPRLPFAIIGRSDDVNGKGAPWPGDVPTNYQLKMLRANKPVYAIGLERTPS
jgi:tRNA (guanine-N7-)-methyltransferase